MGVLPLLSWSSARLLALLLNALSGLLRHLERESENSDRIIVDWDSLLGITLIQESLMALDCQFRDHGYHPAIFQALRNLSAQSEHLLMIRKGRAQNVDPELFAKLAPLFTVRTRAHLEEHKLVDERLRWAFKDQKDRKSGDEMGTKLMREEVWINPNESTTEMRCLISLLASNCSLAKECADHFLVDSHRQIGTALTRQLLFSNLIADQIHRRSLPSSASPAHFTSNPYNSSAFLEEICANVLDELNILAQRNNRKQLARIRGDTLALLMEQVFLCGRQGFVQFANPHLLLTMLHWQHPELGCWTALRPDPVPNLGMAMEVNMAKRTSTENAEKEMRSSQEEQCLPHLSIVSGLAIASVYLRLALDPGPWPEHVLTNQLVQFDGVIAEDKFIQFPYLQWVRDSNIGGEAAEQQAAFRPIRPPPSSWSPDLIAFVCLLFLVVLVFVVFAHFCGDNGQRRGGIHKKLYPYAFKKM